MSRERGTGRVKTQVSWGLMGNDSGIWSKRRSLCKVWSRDVMSFYIKCSLWWLSQEQALGKLLLMEGSFVGPAHSKVTFLESILRLSKREKLII